MKVRACVCVQQWPWKYAPTQKSELKIHEQQSKITQVIVLHSELKIGHKMHLIQIGHYK
jgi:hypothetical protein